MIADGDDEELLEAGKPGRVISSGAVGVLVTLAVVIAAAVWLATRGGSPTPTPSPSTAVPSTEALTLPALTSSVPAPPPAPGPIVDPTRCPGSNQCDSSREIPTHLVAVVRRYVPGVRGQAGFTVFHTSGAAGLWYRQLNAVTGRYAVLVIVSRRSYPTAPPTSAELVTDGRDIAYVRRHTRGFQVQVQVDGPRPHRPPLAALRRLAADPRVTMLP